MSRYNNQERIGIHKFSLFVTEHFEWVCREQSVADVGIDVLVEQAIEGNPTGKLLAFQVKSGDSNFYENKNGELVYYVSNIHHDYWLSFDLPVILVLYSEKYNEMFWQVIDKTTLQKTEGRWKIIVPTKQKLIIDNQKDFEDIIELNVKKFTIEAKLDKNLYDIISEIEYTQFATDSLIRQKSYIDNFSNHMALMTIQLQKNLNTQQRNAILNKTAVVFTTFAFKMMSEIPIFAENYSKGTIAFTELSKLYLLINIPLQYGTIEIFETNFASTRHTLKAFDEAINGVISLRKSTQSFLQIPQLMSSSKKINKTLDGILIELQDAKILTEDLIKKLDMIKKP
jgi:hypothetical protein